MICTFTPHTRGRAHITRIHVRAHVEIYVFPEILVL